MQNLEFLETQTVEQFCSEQKVDRIDVKAGIKSRDHNGKPIYYTLEEIKEGKSQNQISKEYGISRYAIQSWIGARPEKNVLPKQRGRKPAKTLQEYKYENKRLKMENELLRDFLSLTERK